MNSNSTLGRIVLSSFFFFFYMAMAVWMAFLNVYLENNGYSGSEIGFIGAAYQGAIFIASPFMGILSDKYGVKKVIMILISISIILLLFYAHIGFFPVLFVYTFILASLTQPVGALIDSIAITFVRYTNRSSFGRYRLWGSVGWSLSTYFTGMIITRYGVELIFPLAACVFVIMIILVMIYPVNETNSSSTKLTREHLIQLFKNKTVVMFSLLLLIYGVVLAPLNMFINLYFMDIGASYEIVGQAFSIQAITEIPFFFLAIYFVRKYGAEKSIVLSILVTILRIVLYSIITDPEISIWIGLGQGFTFSLFLVAVVEFFHDIIPQNLRATGQSLIWASHFGAGVTIGNIIIGYLYEAVGMVWVMKLSGISCILVTLLFFLFFRSNKKTVRTTYST